MSRPARSRASLVWLAVLALGLVMGLVTACGGGGSAPADPASGDAAVAVASTTGTLEPAGEPGPNATVVTVGIYGINAYAIDPGANTFYMSAYVWLRWHGDIDPVATLEFANMTEERLRKTLLDPVMELPNGDKLQQLKVQGRFFDPYNLSDYPLDRQSISIYVEDSTYTADTVVYQADTSGTGYDSSLQIPGWDVTGMTVANLVHEYGTNFGDPAAGASSYSAAEFSLHIARLRSMFLWKLLLPLLLVLCTNWLALVLPPRFADARMAMPATALLTTVFLQQSSLAAIPQVSTLVLMDVIYLMAYIAIVATAARVILANLRYRPDLDAAVVARMHRTDLVLLTVQAVVVIGALVQMVVSRS